MVAINCKWT